MLHELHSEVILATILLFIYCFKFSLKESKHRVDKAFTIQLAPLGYILWGTLAMIYGLIKGSIGVDSSCAIACKQFRELVGNGIFGCLLIEFVDL